MDRHYQHLQAEERCTLASLLQQCFNLRAIGRLLQRSSSAISREIKRYRADDGVYRSEAAQSTYRHRRKITDTLAKLHEGGWLWFFVCHLLLKWQWSPPQISRILKRVKANEPRQQVSHETIYTAEELDAISDSLNNDPRQTLN